MVEWAVGVESRMTRRSRRVPTSPTHLVLKCGLCGGLMVILRASGLVSEGRETDILTIVDRGRRLRSFNKREFTATTTKKKKKKRRKKEAPHADQRLAQTIYQINRQGSLDWPRRHATSRCYRTGMHIWVALPLQGAVSYAG